MNAQIEYDAKFLEDFQSLEKMTGKKILKPLIELYIHSTEDLIAEAELALQNFDFETLSRHFHSLKSSSGNLGLTGVQKMCGYLEEEALKLNKESLKEIEDIKIQIKKARTLVDASFEYLKKYEN